MREIRYRGIGIAERKWVFGSLWFDTRNKATLIWSEEVEYWVRVDPATVGEYTGLKDKNGKEIYEGDVIRSPLSEDKTRPHRIFYHTGNAAFMGALVDRKELCYLRLDQDWIYKFGKEVIGNIHDNPELLKKRIAMTPVIIIAIATAIVGASIATIFYTTRLDKMTREEADHLVKRVAIETEIDMLNERITIIHGRITNLEKRVEPIGFQEVITKHADQIAAICCREYSKLFEDGHDERGDADNKGND